MTGEQLLRSLYLTNGCRIRFTCGREAFGIDKINSNYEFETTGGAMTKTGAELRMMMQYIDLTRDLKVKAGGRLYSIFNIRSQNDVEAPFVCLDLSPLHI